MNALRRLRTAVKALGFNLGWRFWRIENAALRDPTFSGKWAEACIKEGNKFAVLGNQVRAECYWDWAEKLKDSQTAWNVQRFKATMTHSEKRGYLSL